MGPGRLSQDPHVGRRYRPKLTLVGRLAGTLNGRPWSSEMSGSKVTLRLADLSQVRLVHRIWSSASRTSGLMPLEGLVVHVRVGSYLRFRIIPRPAGPLGWLMPSLTKAGRGQ